MSLKLTSPFARVLQPPTDPLCGGPLAQPGRALTRGGRGFCSGGSVA